MKSNLVARLIVVLVILTIPAAVALLNPPVPFGNTGCDSWAWFSQYTFNYQRFWDYPPSISSYITGRLPGMFPGFVVYHLFSPIVATYVFYFLMFWTTLWPGTSRRANSRSAGVPSSPRPFSPSRRTCSGWPGTATLVA